MILEFGPREGKKERKKSPPPDRGKTMRSTDNCPTFEEDVFAIAWLTWKMLWAFFGRALSCISYWESKCYRINVLASVFRLLLMVEHLDWDFILKNLLYARGRWSISCITSMEFRKDVGAPGELSWQGVLSGRFWTGQPAAKKNKLVRFRIYSALGAKRYPTGSQKWFVESLNS